MRSSAAFSLLELLITLAVISILLTVAAPSLQATIRRNQLAVAINSFVVAAQLARSHAATSGFSTVLCKRRNGADCEINGGWEQGWLLFEDPDHDGVCGDTDGDGRCDLDQGRILRIAAGLSAGITLSGNGHGAERIRYASNGFSPGYMSSFVFCDTREGAAKTITLTATGRLRLSNALGSCG